MRRRTPLALACVLLAGGVVGGCGADDGAGGSPSAKVRAVATTTQVGDLVRQVGGGRVAVAQILQPNSDPHDYEPRPSDAREIERADVVFRSGGDLDEWTADLIKANQADAGTVELIKSVRTRQDGDDADPHWWQNPRNAQAAVGAIRDRLIAADPEGRAGYRRRAAAYTRKLRTLDSQVADCVNRLPRGKRKLVTTHDALGYYTDRYGVTLVGAVIPSLSTQAQPSSKDVNALVDQIRKQKVKAIFPESSLNPKVEKAVARESGATVGGALWADTLGPGDSKGATYIASVQDNTSTIVGGLSAGAARCRFS